MTSQDQFRFPEKDSPQPQAKPSVRNIAAAIPRYILAVVLVALAIPATLFLQHYGFRGVALFLFAIALTVWYADVGPALLATVLSILCFKFFFSPPIYSLAFSVDDVPAAVILLSFALLIIRFSAVRRRIEGQLLHARDHLQLEVVERTRQADLLRRSEAYLAEAQRLSKTGSWAFKPGMAKPVYWSDEMFRIWGFDPRQGLPDNETAWQRIHPEDFEAITREEIEKASTGSFKVDIVHEHRIVLPDGTLKYLRGTAHPVFNDAGEVVEYVGTSADVTEHKRAEETLLRSEAYLAEAQRLSHTGSWAYSHAMVRAIYWSEETFRIFGLDPQGSDPPYYDEFIRLIHPEDRDRFRENTLRCYREKAGFTQEYRLMLPDGTVKYIHEIGHPVLDGKSNLVEYLGTLIDVTERKRAEEEIERLRRLEADLARVNRVSMMGELAASLAHEVKQPIAAAATNAKTSLRWLEREPPDIVEAREAVSRIVKDVLRAADIIDRNRALYRRDKPKRETVDLNELIREMTALLVDAASRQSVSIRSELDGDAPTVAADRVQMQQVLMNLMLNGIEAMKDTGGELTIRSKKTEDRQLLLSVSDVGCGLPGENADRVFDAFFTTKAQGTGMGLSICRRIIESHGGRLWACANTARGATFHFTLPNEALVSSTSAG